MKYSAVLFDWGDTIRGSGEIPPFLHEMIPQLFTSGYRLGIVSNSHRYGDARWLRRQLGKLDWIQYFEVVIGSGGTLGSSGESSTGCHKPDPSIYWKAVNFLGLEPKDCVFLGDSFKCDVLGPQELGMAALYVHVSKDYSDQLWKLLEDQPTERLNVITTYSNCGRNKVQFYIRDLSEPLTVGCPLFLGKQECVVESFSKPHTKDDILSTGGTGYQLMQVRFSRREEL